MSAQGLAFTAPFVVESNTQFRPGPPRALASPTYAEDLDAVKALGRRTGSTRTDAQTQLAPFWEGNASVHWNQAANQIARANQLSMSDSNRLLAVLNIAMADTALTIWSAKRHYGADPAQVTWRPLTAITLADADGVAETAADPDWLPLVAHTVAPGIPCRATRPQRCRCDGTAESLCRQPDICADDVGPARQDVHGYLAGSRRRQQRSRLGRDALPQHGCDQRRSRRSDRRIRQRRLDAVAPRCAQWSSTSTDRQTGAAMECRPAHSSGRCGCRSAGLDVLRNGVRRRNRCHRVRLHESAAGVSRARRCLPDSDRGRRRCRGLRRDRRRTRCGRSGDRRASAVTPGETLRVRVGGWGGEAVGSTPGAGGWNGGGAGGEALDRAGKPAPAAAERPMFVAGAMASRTGSSSVPEDRAAPAARSAARSGPAAATGAI